MHCPRILQLFLQALVYPQSCCLCGKRVRNPDWSPICPECFHSLKPLAGPVCWVCGIPVSANILGDGYPCSRCRTGGFSFDRARSWGIYESGLREVIHHFKFRGFQRLAEPLSSLLIQVFRQSYEAEEIDCLVPVPLHRRRRRQRGFDQTRLLAERVSSATGIPIFRALRRTRYTEPQYGLDVRRRRRNLRNAFELLSAGALEKKRVVIIDDILTTGVTAHELSRLLKKKGRAQAVGVLTLARVKRNLS